MVNTQDFKWLTLKTNEDTNLTRHQQDGGPKGRDDKTVYGRGWDSSVPADGREDLQVNIN